MKAKSGPTWEELEDWCRHNLVDFKRMRRDVVRYAADKEAKRTLDEMVDLAKKAQCLTGADWLANQRLWDIAYKAHDRAMAVAYPSSEHLVKGTPK